jgi:disulfide bond formation protein DsbB
MTLIVTTFLAILTLIAALGVVAIVVLGALGQLARVRGLLGPAALWPAFGVALTATAGSLYLSEVAGFVPCTLCWYQRIAMYPLVVILGIAAWRGDAGIRRYVVPVAAIGAVIAAYHVALQRLPGLPSGACSLDAPCSAIYVERFGFVTIPVMALVAFLAILTLLLGLVPSGDDIQIQEPPLT